MHMQAIYYATRCHIAYVVPSAEKMVALIYTDTQPCLDVVVRHLLHDAFQVVKHPSVFALSLQCCSALPWLVLCMHLSKLVEKCKVCQISLTLSILCILSGIYAIMQDTS